MKILMVNKFLYPNGGSETYIFKIGEYLLRKGHEVQYFGMEHEGRIVGNHAESYTQNMDFHTGKLQKLCYPFKILYSAEAKKKMQLVLQDFEPDVVHLNNFNFQLTPSIIYAVKRYEKKMHKKVKIIFTAHDYQLLCPNHMMMNPQTKRMCEQCMGGNFIHCTRGNCIHGSAVKSLLGTMEGYLYKVLRTYRYLDKIICPSEFIKTKFDLNPMFKGKTIALHNFIDKVDEASDINRVNTIKSVNAIDNTNDNTVINKSVNTNLPENYILYFGRFSEEKGIKTLLSVCESCSDIPFVFAGNGPLEAEVNQVKNICNVGFQTGKELAELIKNARFAIVPSEWYENCPFSVMEAQMYGTPVIGANIGGIPELIQEGKTGILFQSGNEANLQAVIEDLWQDTEKIKQYTINCGKITFDTLAKYCEKLLLIYEAV